MNDFTAEHLRPHLGELRVLCQVKLDEFRLLGYERIEFDELWAYVGKKTSPAMPLHQIVDFILSIRIMGFMNDQTMSAYRGELGP